MCQKLKSAMSVLNPNDELSMDGDFKLGDVSCLISLLCIAFESLEEEC